MKLSFVSKKVVRNIKIIVCAAYIFYFIVCCVSLAENISHPIKIGQPIKIGNLGNEFMFFLLFAVMTMVQTILYHVLKSDGEGLSVQMVLSAVKFVFVMLPQASIGSQNIYFGDLMRSIISLYVIFAIAAIALCFIAEFACAVYLKVRLKKSDKNYPDSVT